MEFTKDSLKKMITEKMKAVQEKSTEKEPKRSKIKYFKNRKIKKSSLNYEVFLQ